MEGGGLMPRNKNPAPAAGDFRTPEQRRADKGLVGSWWRCPACGLVEDLIALGDVAYCAEDGCYETLLLAHSAMRDSGTRPRDWNGIGDGRAPVRKAPKRSPKKPRGRVRVVDAVLQVLRERAGGPVRLRELRDPVQRLVGLELHPNRVSSALSELRRAGKAVNPKYGLWQVTKGGIDG